MAKAIGINLVLKHSWFVKAVSLLEDGLDEAGFGSALEDYLAFEIDSSINRKKLKRHLMSIWYQDSESVAEFQQEGRRLIKEYPEYLDSITWCMISLAYPVFADYARIMGKMFEYQDSITTTQVKKKIFDQFGEISTLNSATTRMISIMKELNAIDSISVGRHKSKITTITNDEIIAFMIRVAMYQDNQSYYAFSSLNDFPFLFPFKYQINKAAMVNDKRFELSTFDSTLCISLK